MGKVFWRFSALLLLCTFSEGVSAHTVEFETTRVTAPDVTLARDGQTLVFSMLGHLFLLPTAGGTAEQLTFGPYYDNQPAFSPDGSQIALHRTVMAAMATFFCCTFPAAKFSN